MNEWVSDEWVSESERVGGSWAVHTVRQMDILGVFGHLVPLAHRTFGFCIILETILTLYNILCTFISTVVRFFKLYFEVGTIQDTLFLHLYHLGHLIFTFVPF